MQPITALITGGSRGIGLAIAKKLVPSTSSLLITSRVPETAAHAERELKSTGAAKVLTFSADFDKPVESARSIAEWAKKQLASLDLLVLNAGYYVEGTLAEIGVDDFEENLRINFAVNHYLVQELLPLVKSSALRRIVLIGSTAAYEPYPMLPTYGVAKWALRGYAMNLRRELMSDNVGVTFLAPGGTLTDMWAGEDLPQNRLLDPDDIATLVLALTTLSPQAVVEELICRPMLGDIHE